MKAFIKRLLLITSALALTGFFTIALAAQCLGTTRAGHQCKNQAPAGSSYCHYHDPAVKHCAAKTKDGSPCRNTPESGSAYCRAHKR